MVGTLYLNTVASLNHRKLPRATSLVFRVSSDNKKFSREKVIPRRV
jgi:hypothetical protein